MNELITLARPYANASFEHAYEASTLNKWSTALATLAAVTEEQAVVNFLSSPKTTAQEKVTELINICGDIIDDTVGRFLTVMAENRRLLLLPQVQQLFENLKAKQEKLLNVEVLTAFPLDQDAEQALADKLGANFDSRINLTVGVDKTLIGGLVIRIGDSVIDGSVRGRLAKLAESMN